MPLFEVDTQQPLLVSTDGAHTSEPGLKTTANQVVDSHIDGLLGEEVFPISQGSGPSEPHLLALDASGSPVVVELVANLDRENLTKALDHAGVAGRLTRAELAARYSGGASSFQHDVAAFYDSVPITRTQAGRNGGGARLIIICQNAPDEILNAVDFLRQPSMPVEVLKMGVVKAEDGRKFLDVSPLVVHLPSGLSGKSAQLGGSITGSMESGVTGGVAGSSAPPKDAFEEGVKVGYALTGKMPVVVQASANRSERDSALSERSIAEDVSAPSVPVHTSHGQRSSLRTSSSRSAAERGGTRASRRAQAAASSWGAESALSGSSGDSAPSFPVSSVSPDRPGADFSSTPQTPPRLASSRSSLSDNSVPTPRAEPPAEQPSMRRRSRTDRFAAAPPQQEESSPYPPSGQMPSSTAYPPPFVPSPPVQENIWPSAMYEDEPIYRPESSFAPAPEQGLWEPGGYVAGPEDSYLPPEFAVDPYQSNSLEAPGPVLDEQNNLAPSSMLFEEEDDPDLEALARSIGVTTRIVWSRPRRNQYFEAMLLPDGTIELAQGARYRHPDSAATAASGSYTADGWSVWRIGDTGPTLVEEFSRRFA